VGGVDAQGNLLVHPMTWIDERLFGWSHSARRHGVNSATTSRAASSHGTPEGSDDEDEYGDYDNVIGYLHSYESDPQLKKRSRSSHASYADLQHLRRTESSEMSLRGQSASLLTPVESSFSNARTRSRSELNLSQLAPVYHKMATSNRSPTDSPLDSSYSLVTSGTEESAPVSPTKEAGTYFRRQRRSSLTDGVSVDRIGALHPMESFKDGTADLNREIQQAREGDSKEKTD
jgi:glycerol-3-phosphate O-acyltransferase / dihydroxyacetone phosphate acyltransferase